MITTLTACRACGSTRLQSIFDLGHQAFSGVFPRPGASVPTGPLRLVRCLGNDGIKCGLLQLAHTCNLNQLYGMDYGYRSGLNASMVRHLSGKIARILEVARLKDGDLVVDIGSNDGTTLRAWPAGNYDLVGIDPTGVKFKAFYPPHIRLVPDFYPSEAARQALGGRRARVVTSFSMFYDLPDPLGFMRDIAALLEDDGLWVFEQSYMPTMLSTNSFDTICHEHLEYYGLTQILNLAERAGLQVLDVEFNDVNGGSFSVSACKMGAPFAAQEAKIAQVVSDELRQGLDRDEPYLAFTHRVTGACSAVLGFLHDAKRQGKRVYGLGASTKGNILLQRAGIGPDLVAAIGEVNPDKFGCVTPKTEIPIIPEEEMLAQHPDYLLVLPWHFRKFFLTSPRFKGQTFLFPLPQLEVVRSV
jgi:NDP-4-keto-2,6-dideoxyhexose 3-C-methyltransferase